ncbi:hypothetical protein ACWGRK_12040 [Saccharomonospora azurea]|uniref:Uncharacterized protein n=1 Tax=Saccharomonospora azurea NA-128 TaxID=882081 RepID=H8G950_9PSEU|nr:hypothetical protein [Saccharomonospora azurea]EHY90531.1 hypothetical protein SacazDRAFT_03667 [Saccharomonospora azurea NA-128]
MTVLDSPTTTELDDAGNAVERAGQSVHRACTALTRRGDDVRALRAAVRSAARLTRALAAAVDGIAEHAPRAAGGGAATDELVADLAALRNCLAAGAAVVDPALDDLREWAVLDTDREFARRYQEWAAASTPAGS